MSKNKRACERCRFRAYAERKPNSIIARLWRWHTRWCPGWKKYQRELAEEPVPENGSRQRP